MSLKKGSDPNKVRCYVREAQCGKENKEDATREMCRQRFVFGDNDRLITANSLIFFSDNTAVTR